MKKVFIAVVFMMCFTMVKAQDSAYYRKNIELLIKDAQNEFATAQGSLVDEDSTKQRSYYKSNIDLKCGQSFIQKNLDDDSKVAVFYYDLSNDDDFKHSLSFLGVALNIINEMHSSGKYRGKDVTNDDESTTTELKDTEGNYIAELTSSSKDKYMKFLVYSKKWGKR